MPPIAYRSIIALEDNTTEVYMSCTEVLVRIARNILKEPENPKYRSISLGSNVVTNKLLPASGAMQCLFDMGFQEGSDKLILPAGSSLDCVKCIHDELLKRRETRMNKKPDNVVDNKSRENPLLTIIMKEIKAFMDPIRNDFLHKFVNNIYYIWRCESVCTQLKAAKCIPIVDMKENVQRMIRQMQKSIKKMEVMHEEVIDYQELLLMELCKWFKEDFFKWVNTPECHKCNKETKLKERKISQSMDCTIIEVYTCPACNETVLFPRYNDAEELLTTRRGRCGEWAKCFYLMCRSLGWDVRYVVDQTDHVWVEVYSHLKRRWIHCDPCETTVDAPLVYEKGWKKKLSYIIAYSKDEIQDVTWRYSSDHSKVLGNRRECSEEQLVDVICNIRKILLNFASQRRREYVMKRAALELVELLQQKSATESERVGRSSGSLAWRLARGEFSLPEDFTPWTWKLERGREERSKFTLSYCTASDEYTVDGSAERIKGWNNGLYQMESVFRKEEKDWKMVYLARKEGSNLGTLAWRFEVVDNCTIGSIQLNITSQIFESGRVACKIRNDVACVPVPNDGRTFATSHFAGSKYVELLVELSGGCGDSAWQHAQILRQSSGENRESMLLNIHLIPSDKS